jgi:hypothetical protein
MSKETNKSCDRWMVALIVAVLLSLMFAGCASPERCSTGKYKGCYTGKYRLN